MSEPQYTYTDFDQRAARLIAEQLPHTVVCTARRESGGERVCAERRHRQADRLLPVVRTLAAELAGGPR